MRARSLIESLESRRLLATVNVADFGAVPDDGISDTSAIQSAINASGAGDTVLFAVGKYDIGKVSIRTNRTYQGVSGTVIISTGNEFAFDLNGDARDVTINGFRFEGAGIVLSRGQLYSNVHITGNTFANMEVHAIKATIDSDQLIIERNTFRNIYDYGVIELYNTNRLSYSYNRVIDAEHGGHVLGPLNDCRFVNNYMTGLLLMGLEIQRSGDGESVSHNLLVEGNVIYDWKLPNGASFGLSVVAEGGFNTIIRNNYLRNSIAPGSDWNPDLRGQGETFGPAIEAGFETGVVEGNITGGPTQWTAHVGAAGIDMLVRNNRFYGRAQYGDYIVSWPSMHGPGTFIDENNVKDPVKANMPGSRPLHGDANADGAVDLLDYNVMAGNFGRIGASFSDGDFNVDGRVDVDDFNILAANFGAELWPV